MFPIVLSSHERRGLHCMWVPSISTPLVRTRMEQGEGVVLKGDVVVS